MLVLIIRVEVKFKFFCTPTQYALYFKYFTIVCHLGTWGFISFTLEHLEAKGIPYPRGLSPRSLSAPVPVRTDFSGMSSDPGPVVLK